MNRLIPLLLLLVLVLRVAPVWAHVGSPNVLYDGDAGPFPVRVIVRPPEVIPGDAEITVRLREDRKVDKVTVQPALFDAVGFKGAPPPDEARPVSGAPGVWSGQFLLMKEGSWRIRVDVQGPDGKGTVQVPMPAIRNQIFTMDKRLGSVLAALGLFLFAGAVSLVGAAVREVSLPPGETVDRGRLLRARWTAAFAAVFLAFVIWGGKNWWDSAETQLRTTLFQPLGLNATARLASGRPLLALTIEDPGTRSWTPLIPDHGKLMHLFLLREPGFDAFAHLHPVAQGQKDFLAALPPLAAGNYRVYADIVDESGFPQTLVGKVEIPGTWPTESGGEVPPDLDPDDSWRTSEPLSRAAAAAGPQVSRLEGGGTMLWHQESLVANRETTLRFEVRGPAGHPAPLMPYMGMLGHAVISRDDGEVFVHLHPMGTVSMAAQQVFARNESDPEMAGMAGMDHSAHSAHSVHSAHGATSSILSFPYEFPQPGRYRLWVQVKSEGRIMTGVFDTEVGEE